MPRFTHALGRSLVYLSLMGAAYLSPTVVSASAQQPCEGLPADLLDLTAAPTTVDDRRFSLHFDAGAWHGFALPKTKTSTGFVGPFTLAPENGRWAGVEFATLSIKDGKTNAPLDLRSNDGNGHSCPGWLERRAIGAGLTVKQQLFTASPWRTVVRFEIRSERRAILLMSLANASPYAEAISQRQNQVVVRSGGAQSELVMSVRGLSTDAHVEGAGRYAFASGPVTVAAGRPLVFFLDVEHRPDGVVRDPPVSDLQRSFKQTQRRWRGYLNKIEDLRPELTGEPAYHRIAAKAVQTLLANWRAPYGDLRHAGVWPSYSNADFNGFWAWDSWKHSAALARFAPTLAKDQVRAMFDYQNDAGMVADAIYAKAAENNWRDTKPPLAAWAVREIYHATGDRAFVQEIYPRLLKYHQWWAVDRDHDQDGLAEYGSTDGTRIAAAWESGMDNAVRFDKAAMLKNHDGAWSLDQASVDLNAYLYAEKIFLAELAGVIGQRADQEALLAQAAVLKDKISERMFDRQSGYFFDIALSDGAPIKIYGPEGWIPVWAGAATPDQARSVARVMLDPERFATPFPFPTLDASHPSFSPIKGYWRGPVWLDQAWFAVEALERAGATEQAGVMRRRLLDGAEGLRAQAPFYENYDPLTGRGHQSPNFSWAAGHYLLLMMPPLSSVAQPAASPWSGAPSDFPVRRAHRGQIGARRAWAGDTAAN